MRRNAAALALLLLVVPAVARFATSLSDAEAARCALACAKGMGAEKGAACCPLGHGSPLTMSSCAHEGDAGLPGALGPILLAAALLLSLPSSAGRIRPAPALATPFPPSRLLDKVPLLLG